MTGERQTRLVHRHIRAGISDLLLAYDDGFPAKRDLDCQLTREEVLYPGLRSFLNRKHASSTSSPSPNRGSFWLRTIARRSPPGRRTLIASFNAVENALVDRPRLVEATAAVSGYQLVSGTLNLTTYGVSTESRATT